MEDLHAQSLQILKKCVQGEWKVIQIASNGFINISFPDSTFVDIKEDRVELTKGVNDVMNGLHLLNSFSYSWKNKEVCQQTTDSKLICYTTYVMQNNDQEIEGWYFDKIVNDTLYVVVDYLPDICAYERYLFLRIR